MKTFYDPNLVQAAARLEENEDFRMLIIEHISNLKTYTMDATEPADVLKSHNEHSAIVGFVDYVKMLGEPSMKNKKEPEHYG